jgi:hypothetical protein
MRQRWQRKLREVKLELRKRWNRPISEAGTYLAAVVRGHVAYYGRMSLGPRQRTAVRGGTLLRYAAPDSDELVAVSDRIVP